MVTHSPDVVGLADRVFRMTEGHLVEEASKQESEYRSQNIGASSSLGKAEQSDDILWKLLNSDT
jgi:hypothetical protein